MTGPSSDAEVALNPPTEAEAEPFAERPLADIFGPRLRRLGDRIGAVMPGPKMILALVLLAALLARVGWLDRPNDALIFDEAYYINAARIIIDEPVDPDEHYAGSEAGIDPNREHPPLGKLIIGGSMKVFGDNELGWRFPSIVAGMFSILLVYLIVRTVGGDEWLGVLAATLLALENLSIVHSRIGTLDMLLTVFMLAGSWAYLRGWPWLAGALVAAAALMKIGGVYALAAILLIEVFTLATYWLQTGKLNRASLLTMAKVTGTFVVVWFAVLWGLDLWVTNFNTPWEHLNFMLDYGFALTREGGPANQESYPWQWLMNDVAMTYLRVDEQIKVGETVDAVRPLTYFRGAMNPVLIGAAPLGIAFAAYRIWSHGDRLALWTVTWFIATWVPFLPPSMIGDRISYIFYMLPTIPAFAIGLALLLRRGKLSQIVVWGFLIAVLIGFIAYYPIRRF